MDRRLFLRQQVLDRRAAAAFLGLVEDVELVLPHEQQDDPARGENSRHSQRHAFGRAGGAQRVNPRQLARACRVNRGVEAFGAGDQRRDVPIWPHAQQADVERHDRRDALLGGSGAARGFGVVGLERHECGRRRTAAHQRVADKEFIRGWILRVHPALVGQRQRDFLPVARHVGERLV